MKKLSLIFAVVLFTAFTAGNSNANPETIKTNSAEMAEKRVSVGNVLSGLINANISDIRVNIGDVTVADLVDVNNVLNNNDIRILNNVLNRNVVASNNSDILTNLLRDAELITENQVVVGVLSGQFVIQDI